MTVRKAIVTMAVGEAYAAEFDARVRRNWTVYADRHDYSLYVLGQPIDDRPGRSIHWQKLIVGLLPELRAFDFVVWIDADILINPRTAPCVVSQVSGDKIAVAEPWAAVSPAETVEQRHLTFAVKFLAETEGRAVRSYVRRSPEEWRLIKPSDKRPIAHSINTGMFVFRPALHSAFLSECYVKDYTDWPDGSFEQTPVSYELQANDMVEFVDGRFNAVWSQHAAVHYPFLFDRAFLDDHAPVARLCVNTFFHNNYFCHFAGHGGHAISKRMMAMVDQQAPHLLAALAPETWAERDALYADLDDGDEATRRSR